MPEGNEATDGKQMKLERQSITAERVGYIEGLFKELEEQVLRYVDFSRQHQKVLAQLEIAENTVQAIRGYIYTQLANTEEEVHTDWKMLLKKVRFVGARLGDACADVLKDRSSLNRVELLDELNKGQFRFRTAHPLREINAALLRHPKVNKNGQTWIYIDTEPTVEGTVVVQ